MKPSTDRAASEEKGMTAQACYWSSSGDRASSIIRSQPLRNNFSIQKRVMIGYHSMQ
ncbi:MAG: hypothetical protein NVS4B1_02370 [Ktedonobacteraceae bacterium]